MQELSHDGVTVVFENTVPTFAWVELRKKGQATVTKYYHEVEGQHQAYDYIQAPSVALPVQNFVIRINGLNEKTTYEYRVCAQKIDQMKKGANYTIIDDDDEDVEDNNAKYRDEDGHTLHFPDDAEVEKRKRNIH